MKKTIMYFLTGMFVIFLFSNTFAQTDVSTTTTVQTTTVEQKAATAIGELSNVITLSAEQTEKITPFVTEFFKQKELDLTQNKGNAELLESAAKLRWQTLMKNLATVLTEPQLAEFKTYWKNQKEKSKTNTEINKVE